MPYVLHGISYANALLLHSTLPSYSSGKTDKNGKRQEEIDISEFKDNRERIRQAIESVSKKTTQR